MCKAELLAALGAEYPYLGSAIVGLTSIAHLAHHRGRMLMMRPALLLSHELCAGLPSTASSSKLNLHHSCRSVVFCSSFAPHKDVSTASRAVKVRLLLPQG